MANQPGELSIFRFISLSFVTYVLTGVIVNTFIFPINWNWLGLLAGALGFSIVFVIVLKYRERKKYRQTIKNSARNSIQLGAEQEVKLVSK